MFCFDRLDDLLKNFPSVRAALSKKYVFLIERIISFNIYLALSDARLHQHPPQLKYDF